MKYAWDPDAAATSVIDRGQTRDGLSQLRRQWVADDPVASVLLVHGIAEHCGRYEHVGRQLADAGLSTVAYDQRGFGESGGTRAYVDHFEQYHDDLEDHLAEVRAVGLPTVILGHSMGGLISVSYVLSGRPRPDALVLSAPALGADAPAWMRRGAGIMSRIAPRFHMAAPFESHMLSRDPRVGEHYDADPLVHLPTSTRLGAELFRTIDATRENIAKIDVPTLLLHGDDDVLVPVGATEIVEGLPGVDRRVLPGARHELFNEPDGPEAVADVIAWIRATLSL